MMLQTFWRVIKEIEIMKYEKPEFTIIEFLDEDIILTSGEGDVEEITTGDIPVKP